MKIAIPHWRGRVSPVFDASDSMVVIDIEDGRERRRENVALYSRDPFRRAQEVSGLGADVILCGAVSQTLERALLGAGVRVQGFICGNVDVVVNAFLHGRLSEARFHMPGGRGGRHRSQGGKI
jgi:predicted Fe-Mo cluster-binding NifX family protein